MKIVMNEFCNRQVKGSSFSYFEGSLEGLIAKIEDAWAAGNHKPGFREGVVLVSVDPTGFKSAMVALEDATSITTTYEARREGEGKFATTRAAGPTQDAKFCEIVLYTQAALEGDASKEQADYEIVSMNADDIENAPMGLAAMVRNTFELPGGTKAEYPAEEWARAAQYALQNANVIPTNPGQ